MDWETYSKKRAKKTNTENMVKSPKSIIGLIILFIIISAVYSSWYTVQTEETAVITRFGKYTQQTPPGLHFKLPWGVDRVTKVKNTLVHEESFGFIVPQKRTLGFNNLNNSSFYRKPKEESLMLTGDLNVADVKWVVQYKISDPKKYLYNVANPQKNLRDISQATMRRVVGDRTVTEVLTVGSITIAQEAKELTQSILDNYNLGVEIINVLIKQTNPPEEVKPSFDEVTAAKQEQEQAINIAEKKYNEKIPEAKGLAEKEISFARGFAIETVNKAKGDAERFNRVLTEYKKAPKITKTRLYLEMVEDTVKKIENFTVVDSEIQGLLPIFSNQNNTNLK